MTVSAPPARRRLVGRTLRRHREALGWTLDDAARVLECDRSKVSRIETGERGIRVKELRELMEGYGIAGGCYLALASLGAMTRARRWLSNQRGGPATPITLPSGSAKCPTANSPSAGSGPIRRVPPRLSAVPSAASTLGTPM
jgi:transcriptional regulator with XRE-family HTH domain